MGKRTKKQSTYATAQTFKIRKNKNSKENLKEYVKLLKTKYSHISTKEYLSFVHKYIKKLAQAKGGFEKQFVVQTKSMIKICQRCDKWAMGSKKMVQCYSCQDSYHLQCAKDYFKGQWYCQVCIQSSSEQNKQLTKKKDQDQVICFKCHLNKNQPTVKCLKCNCLFHKQCFGRQSIVCQQCDAKIEAKLTKVRQLTLKESFQNAQIYSSKKKQRANKSKQKRQKTPNKKEKNLNTEFQQQKVEITKPFSRQISQNTNSTVIVSNSKNFRSSFPKMTPQQISFYKQKLLYAIQTKNMNYNQQLVCHRCSLFDNNEDSLDFALSQLSISDFRMYKEYKRQPIGPFLLQFKQGMGYDVVADKDLPKGMIICEYVGDVYTFRETIKILNEQNNDSLMQLTFGKNADQSLFIVPRKFTNIARFLNGVNEKDPLRKQKENVHTLRSLAQGKPVVILYTSRSVKKGESLLYDYGAGGANKYDTTQYQ